MKDVRLPHWLEKERPAEFAGWKKLWGLRSPQGDVAVVCAGTRTWLFKVRYVGALIRIRQPWTILGQPVIGRRTSSGWMPTT